MHQWYLQVLLLELFGKSNLGCFLPHRLLLMKSTSIMFQDGFEVYYEKSFFSEILFIIDPPIKANAVLDGVANKCLQPREAEAAQARCLSL